MIRTIVCLVFLVAWLSFPGMQIPHRTCCAPLTKPFTVPSVISGVVFNSPIVEPVFFQISNNLPPSHAEAIWVSAFFLRL